MQQLQNALAVLRASGPDWDAETVLRQHHLDTRAVWWRAGDRQSGQPTTDSGFNLIIADAVSGLKLSQDIGEWLRQHDGLLRDLGPAGAKSVLKIFLTVEDPEHPAQGVILAPADLAVLARSGIELAFTAYPPPA